MADIRWEPSDSSLPPKKEKEEEKGFLSGDNSPLAMGLLHAGASLMRQSGWRRRPVTTGEAIGYAIPEGIRGFQNQKVFSQQEEARQQQIQQAQQQQELLLQQQQQEQIQIQQAIAMLDRIPTNMIRPSAKDALKWQLRQGGSSAQEAIKEIVKLTTKDEVKSESYGDIKFGTFGVGSINALALIDQNNLTVPKSAKNLNILPVKAGDTIHGYKTEWLDKDGQPVKSKSQEEKEAEGYEYIFVGTDKLKKEFSEKRGNFPVPDDATTMVLNPNKKVESYLNDDGKTYDFSVDIQDREIKEDKLLKQVKTNIANFTAESNDPRIQEWFNEEGVPKVFIPAGTKNVRILPDGNIEFLDEFDQKVSESPTMVVGIYNKNTKNIEDILINKKTGETIKNLGISKAYETPSHMWQANMDKTEKKLKLDNFQAYLKDIQETYEIPDWQIEEWSKLSNSDFDTALAQSTNFAENEAKRYGAIRSGKQLNTDKRVAGNYEADRYYKKTADGVWEEYRPHSDERLSGETGLRKEYNQLTRDHRIAARGYDGIMSGLMSDTGFGDIMAITSFRIMFEPNSVVREAEFEITSKAGGWLESFLNSPDRFMDGDRLSDEARRQMYGLVQEYMTAIEKRSDKHYKEYTDIADKRKYDKSGITEVFRDHNFGITYDQMTKTGYVSTGEGKDLTGLKSEDVQSGNVTFKTFAQRMKDNAKRRKK